ncbi:MAG: hypothetical protein QM817_41835 [Archangium sp.]
MRRSIVLALCFTACGSFFPRTDAGTEQDAGTDAGVCDAGAACPPVEGGACTSGVVCDGAQRGLECRLSTWRAFPCRGLGGCMSFPQGPTCDFNGALAGDQCPLDVEGRRACSVDGHQVIECRNGTFVETLNCSSCTLTSGVVNCTP